MKTKEKVYIVGLSVLLSLTLTGCFTSKPASELPKIFDITETADNVKEQKDESPSDKNDVTVAEKDSDAASLNADNENTLTPADIPSIMELTAESVGIEMDTSSDNYKLANELFRYMFLPDIFTRGGDCIQGQAYFQGMVFGAADINADGQKEAFIGPDLYAVDMVVPADSFEKGNVLGGIVRINPATGIIEVSDSVAPHFYIMEDTLKEYIRVMPVLDSDEDKPDDESLVFYVEDEKGNKTYLSMNDGLNYDGGMDVPTLDQSGIGWIYLTPENVITSLFEVEEEPTE